MCSTEKVRARALRQPPGPALQSDSSSAAAGQLINLILLLISQISGFHMWSTALAHSPCITCGHVVMSLQVDSLLEGLPGCAA